MFRGASLAGGSSAIRLGRASRRAAATAMPSDAVPVEQKESESGGPRRDRLPACAVRDFPFFSFQLAGASPAGALS